MNAPFLAYMLSSTVVTAFAVIAQAAADAGAAAIITQLGAFAVAAAVAYWFLKRSDRRDEANRVDDKESRETLRDELRQERLDHTSTRKELIEALKREAQLAVQVVPPEEYEIYEE